MAYNVEIPGWLQGIARVLNFGIEYPDARGGDMAALAQRVWLGPAAQMRAITPFVQETMGDIEDIYTGRATEPLLKQMRKLTRGKHSLDTLADAMEEFGRSIQRSADAVTKTQLMQLGFAAYTLYLLWKARVLFSITPWGRVALPAIEAGIVAAGRELVAVAATRGAARVSAEMAAATMNRSLAPLLTRFGSLGPLGKLLGNELLRASGKAAALGAVIDGVASLAAGADLEWQSIFISGVAWGFAPLTGGPAAWAMSRALSAWTAPLTAKRLLLGVVTGQAGMAGMWAGGIVGQVGVGLLETGGVEWANVDTSFDPHVLGVGAGLGLLHAAGQPVPPGSGGGAPGAGTARVADLGKLTPQSRREGGALYRELMKQLHPDKYPEGPARARAAELYAEVSEIRNQAKGVGRNNEYYEGHVSRLKEIRHQWNMYREGLWNGGANDGSAPHPNSGGKFGAEASGPRAGSPESGGRSSEGGARSVVVPESGVRDGGSGKSLVVRPDAGRAVEGRSSVAPAARSASTGDGGGVVAARSPTTTTPSDRSIPDAGDSSSAVDQVLQAVERRGREAAGVPVGVEDLMPGAVVREGVDPEAVLNRWADAGGAVPQWRGPGRNPVYFPGRPGAPIFEQGVLPDPVTGLVHGFTSMAQAREYGSGVVYVVDAPGGFVQDLSSGGQAVVLLGGVAPEFVVGRYEYTEMGTIHVANPGFDPARPPPARPDAGSPAGPTTARSPREPGQPQPGAKPDPATRSGGGSTRDPETSNRGRPGPRSGVREAPLTPPRPGENISAADRVVAAMQREQATQQAVEAGMVATGFPPGENPMPAAVRTEGVDMPGLFAGWGKSGKAPVWQGESGSGPVYCPISEAGSGRSPFTEGIEPEPGMDVVVGYDSLEAARQFAGPVRIYVIDAPGGFAQDLPDGGRVVVFPGGVRGEFVVGRHQTDLDPLDDRGYEHWSYVENPSFGLPYTEPVGGIEPKGSGTVPKPVSVAGPGVRDTDGGQVAESGARTTGGTVPSVFAASGHSVFDTPAAGAAPRIGPVTVPGHEPAVAVSEPTSTPEPTSDTNADPTGKGISDPLAGSRDPATESGTETSRSGPGAGPLPATPTTRMADRGGAEPKTPATVGRDAEPLLVGQCATYAAYEFELANWAARGRVGPRPVKPPPGNPLRGDSATDIAKHVRGDWHRDRTHHRSLSELIHKVMTTPGMRVLFVVEYSDGFGHAGFAEHDPEHEVVIKHSFDGGFEYTHAGRAEAAEFIRAFANETHRVTSIQSYDGVLEAALAPGEEPRAIPGLYMPRAETLVFGSPTDPQRFIGADSSLLGRSRTGGRPLSPAQRAIVDLIVRGMANTDIAARLEISESAVKSQVKRIYDRLGITDRNQLVGIGEEALAELIRGGGTRVLSQTELGILRMIVQGVKNPGIARNLGLSEYTVRSYVKRIYDKLGVSNRNELVGNLDIFLAALLDQAIRPLSERQKIILRLVAQGRGNAEIAEFLHITETTVKGYVTLIGRKLGVAERGDMVVMATAPDTPIRADVFAESMSGPADHAFLQYRRRIALSFLTGSRVLAPDVARALVSGSDAELVRRIREYDEDLDLVDAALMLMSTDRATFEQAMSRLDFVQRRRVGAAADLVRSGGQVSFIRFSAVNKLVFEVAEISSRSTEGFFAGVHTSGLLETEFEILELVATSHTNPEIAQKISVDVASVKKTISTIMEKLDANDRTHLVVQALRHRIISPSRIAPLERAPARSSNGPEGEPVRLSPRERSVLPFIAAGLTNKRIGSLLGVSPETVKSALQSLFRKLGVEDRTGAVVEAWRRGYLDSENIPEGLARHESGTGPEREPGPSGSRRSAVDEESGGSGVVGNLLDLPGESTATTETAAQRTQSPPMPPSRGGPPDPTGAATWYAFGEKDLSTHAHRRPGSGAVPPSTTDFEHRDAELTALLRTVVRAQREADFRRSESAQRYRDAVRRLGLDPAASIAEHMVTLGDPANIAEEQRRELVEMVHRHHDLQQACMRMDATSAELTAALLDRAHWASVAERRLLAFDVPVVSAGPLRKRLESGIREWDTVRREAFPELAAALDALRETGERAQRAAMALVEGLVVPTPPTAGSIENDPDAPIAAAVRTITDLYGPGVVLPAGIRIGATDPDTRLQEHVRGRLVRVRTYADLVRRSEKLGPGSAIIVVEYNVDPAVARGQVHAERYVLVNRTGTVVKLARDSGTAEEFTPPPIAAEMMFALAVHPNGTAQYPMDPEWHSPPPFGSMLVRDRAEGEVWRLHNANVERALEWRRVLSQAARLGVAAERLRPDNRENLMGELAASVDGPQAVTVRELMESLERHRWITTEITELRALERKRTQAALVHHVLRARVWAAEKALGRGEATVAEVRRLRTATARAHADLARLDRDLNEALAARRPVPEPARTSGNGCGPFSVMALATLTGNPDIELLEFEPVIGTSGLDMWAALGADVVNVEDYDDLERVVPANGFALVSEDHTNNEGHTYVLLSLDGRLLVSEFNGVELHEFPPRPRGELAALRACVFDDSGHPTHPLSEGARARFRELAQQVLELKAAKPQLFGAWATDARSDRDLRRIMATADAVIATERSARGSTGTRRRTTADPITPHVQARVRRLLAEAENVPVSPESSPAEADHGADSDSVRVSTFLSAATTVDIDTRSRTNAIAAHVLGGIADSSARVVVVGDVDILLVTDGAGRVALEVALHNDTGEFRVRLRIASGNALWAGDARWLLRMAWCWTDHGNRDAVLDRMERGARTLLGDGGGELEATVTGARGARRLRLAVRTDDGAAEEFCYDEATGASSRDRESTGRPAGPWVGRPQTTVGSGLLNADPDEPVRVSDLDAVNTAWDTGDDR
ncbi:LuxR C-terminal-related transcriptional regulator [Nocardia paucivorans]|uniref:LuxR C-terminal-related transcriptional regulator n=1 Tax=Nocardia paucivorans TaxID=114259 RepID=UPI0003011678|nr:LuxR C-terminal-related transcriptional regulator [Nocardia paucivorans]